MRDLTPLCIYVAGPYRAKSENALEQNLNRAARMAKRVWQLGCVAVCPHWNSARFGGIVPDDWFLDGYLELLSRCDAVLLLPGWQQSEGTRAEVQHADKCNIPVFLDFTALSIWLDRLDD